MSRIAIYGGSFDPPHNGHKRLCENLFEAANVEKAIIDGIVDDEKTYTTDVLPTTEPLKAIEVSVLYQGTKETKWIDCTYNTNILLSFPTQVHGYFSHKGDKINIKRVLKWKYR